MKYRYNMERAFHNNILFWTKSIEGIWNKFIVSLFIICIVNIIKSEVLKFPNYWFWFGMVTVEFTLIIAVHVHHGSHDYLFDMNSFLNNVE